MSRLVRGQAGMYPKRRIKGWGITEIERGTDVGETKQGFEQEDLIGLDLVVQGSGEEEEKQEEEEEEEEEQEESLIELCVEKDLMGADVEKDLIEVHEGEDLMGLFVEEDLTKWDVNKDLIEL